MTEKPLCAYTMHMIALKARECAGVHALEANDCAGEEVTYCKGAAAILEDFADRLWLWINDIPPAKDPKQAVYEAERTKWIEEANK